MAILALAVIPALVLEERGTTPTVRAVAHSVNWFVWVAFVLEYVGKLALSSEKSRFVRAAWFDLVIIALSPPFLVPESWEGARAFRALRLLRLVRALAVASIGIRSARNLLARRRFLFAGTVAVVTVLLGAVGVYVAEGGANRSIQSLPDAMWWAIVTATTVGYGDISPVTWEGRAVAIVLMLIGIGVIGVFTATVASMFLQDDQATDSDLARVEERLSRIELQLEVLLNGAAAPQQDRLDSAPDIPGKQPGTWRSDSNPA